MPMVLAMAGRTTRSLALPVETIASASSAASASDCDPPSAPAYSSVMATVFTLAPSRPRISIIKSASGFPNPSLVITAPSALSSFAISIVRAADCSLADRRVGSLVSTTPTRFQVFPWPWSSSLSTGLFW